MPYKLVPPQAGRSPYWRVRGTELGIRVNRSTKTGDRRLALKILAEWRAQAQRDALSGSNRKDLTFAGAALAYMRADGEGRFLAPLLKRFGQTPLSQIDQSAIDAAAACLYPRATSATRNRQVYSPMSAVLKHAGVERPIRRPKGSQGSPRLDWLRPEEGMRLLTACEAVDERFGALCTFLLYTGVRLSEALRLKTGDLNLSESFAYVRDTKNGEPRAVHLPPAVVASLANLPPGRGNFFGLSKCGRLYDMLHLALDEAAVKKGPRLAFHVFRHTYGAWMRRYAGLDTTGLVATGAWKSRQAAAVYEHADVTEEARKADELPTRAKGVRSR